MSDSGWVPVADSHERGNELLCFVRGSEFLSNLWLLKCLLCNQIEKYRGSNRFSKEQPHRLHS